MISRDSDFKNICNNSYIFIVIFGLLIYSLCALKTGLFFSRRPHERFSAAAGEDTSETLAPAGQITIAFIAFKH